MSDPETTMWIAKALRSKRLTYAGIETLTRAYQTAVGLEVDGKPGPKTLASARDYKLPPSEPSLVKIAGRSVPDLAMARSAWVHGIDISHHQIADWNKVPKSKLFGFFKATEGTTFQDPKMLEFVKQSSVGYVGLYHFARPSSAQRYGQGDPLKECENFVRSWERVGVDTRLLPPVLDFEDERPERGNAAFLTDWAEQWIEHCERLIGRTPIFYTYFSYIWAEMNEKAGQHGVTPPCVARLNKCHLWLADYRGTPPADSGREIPDWPWTFWQHSGTGDCPGIETNCDLNVFRGNPEQLDELVRHATINADSKHWTD